MTLVFLSIRTDMRRLPRRSEVVLETALRRLRDTVTSSFMAFDHNQIALSQVFSFKESANSSALTKNSMRFVDVRINLFRENRQPDWVGRQRFVATAQAILWK